MIGRQPNLKYGPACLKCLVLVASCTTTVEVRHIHTCFLQGVFLQALFAYLAQLQNNRMHAAGVDG
jgi:hypothetical protein